MRVAFIGLGVMGRPMASNVLAGGHEVTAYDVSPRACETLAGAGAKIAANPAEAARAAQAVITVLPDGPAVREALLGPDGACATLPAGGLVIDMSTIASTDSQAIAAAVLARGHRFVDAPVGRTPRHAERGELLVMAGGTADDIAAARPLFDCMADTVEHIGPLGHGIRLKLVNNYVSMIGHLLIAEALTLARKAGIDRDKAVRVMSTTAAGRGQLNYNYPKKVLAGDISPDFPIRFGLKDLALGLGLGSEVNSPLALGAVAREFFTLGIAQGRGDQDCTAMLLLLEDLARASNEDDSTVPPRQ